MYLYRLLFIFLTYITLFSFSYKFYPPVWPDEVLFFSPANQLATYNSFSTPVLEGLIEGMDRATLWMPPLFMLYLAFFFKIFYSDLLIARSASFIASILVCLPLLGIANRLGLQKKYHPLLISLLLTDILFYKISATARMESLCLLISLTGLYVLLTDLKTEIKYLLAGSLSGLSFLSHPFGIVFIPINLFFLYIKNNLNLKSLFLMSAGGILPILAWGSYVIQSFDLFLLQFGAQLGRKKDLLFSVFTLITKVKIILSGFRFPSVKLTLLIFLFFLLIKVLKDKLIKESTKNNLILLFISLCNIILFLFLSSESWYVYYIIPFIYLIIIFIMTTNEIYGKLLFVISLLYNVIVIFFFIINNFILYNTFQLQEKYFSTIADYCNGKKKIYLQAIPDPFFYLQSKNQNYILKEFIPGELPLPYDYPQKEMSEQEVFIFYNEDLAHPFLKEFLIKEQNKFERFEINIPNSRGSEYKLFAVIYRKK